MAIPMCVMMTTIFAAKLRGSGVAMISELFCREDENVVAIDLITEHIRGKLQQHDLRRIFHNLEVIPSNFQTRGMHTIVRCRCMNGTTCGTPFLLSQSC